MVRRRERTPTRVTRSWTRKRPAVRYVITEDFTRAQSVQLTQDKGKRSSRWLIFFAAPSRDHRLVNPAVRSADEVVHEADKCGLTGDWTFELVADDDKVQLRGTVAAAGKEMTHQVTDPAGTQLRAVFKSLAATLIGEHTGRPHRWAIDGIASS